MSCGHGSWDNADSWGGCAQCEELERYEAAYNGLQASTVIIDDPIIRKPFVYDPLYYHIRLKKTPIIFVGHQYTVIEYQGVQLDIPNKIIRYKGKKRKLYVHKRIFHEILKRNHMGILPCCDV